MANNGSPSTVLGSAVRGSTVNQGSSRSDVKVAGGEPMIRSNASQGRRLTDRELAAYATFNSGSSRSLAMVAGGEPMARSYASQGRPITAREWASARESMINRNK